MNRFEERFSTLQVSGKKALVVYIVAGDPASETTVRLMHEMVSQGADIIELGVPFTDPEAEGPVIQLGHERALRARTTLTDTLAMARAFRQQDKKTPIALMGYINPIEAMGYDVFVDKALESGIDGTIIVNLPPEEGEILGSAMIEKGLSPIYLLSPTTLNERAKLICKQSRGFIYYVSLKGTTGASNLNYTEVAERVAKFKAMTDTPILVGFGIKDAESAGKISKMADGAVVGSAIVHLIEQNASEPEVILKEVGSLIASIREGMDSAQ